MSDEQERGGKKLGDVLRLAVANTAHNAELGSVSELHVPILDTQRRAFLDEVLSNLSSSVVKEMQTCLKMLQDAIDSPEENLSSQMESALEQLTEHVSQIDNANDFEKIGGFDVLDSILTENQRLEGVLCETCGLLAELVQNNPHCQDAALKKEFVARMLSMLDSNTNSQVKIKALYALSCLVRHNSQAQKKFEECDGFSILLRSLQTNILKLRIKVSFLIGSLCNERPDYQEVLYSMGFVEQIVGLLHLERDESHEHLLSALLGLASQHERSRDECRREKLNLRALLLDRARILKVQENGSEEHSYTLQLLNTCFQEYQDDCDLER